MSLLLNEEKTRRDLMFGGCVTNIVSHMGRIEVTFCALLFGQ